MKSSYRIDIVSVAPEAFSSIESYGVIGRAFNRGLAELHIHNPRDFAKDRYRKVDDEPFGGGSGMILKPEPIFCAVDSIPLRDKKLVILMTPHGSPISQFDFVKWSNDFDQLVIICGHYGGVDERVRILADQEVSLGDYVLSGGELPALVVISGVIRLLPGVLGDKESLQNESHTNFLLGFPQYTRPRKFRSFSVPPVLLSGNHSTILRWRREESKNRTKKRRPDLYSQWDKKQISLDSIVEDNYPDW